MRNQNRDEKAEQLKEMINNYRRNPEFVGFLSLEEAKEELEKHYKSRYIKHRID